MVLMAVLCSYVDTRASPEKKKGIVQNTNKKAWWIYSKEYLITHQGEDGDKPFSKVSCTLETSECF